MASTSIQAETSSSDSPPQWMYDVFLSFRGKDTRGNFTSLLYSNLVQRGIDVYMDDRELERGKPIEPSLWKAIEESRFSVIIFSTDYASSPWCLDELVKIVQCMKEMGHTVLPVFYDVDPSEVAEGKGKYEKAFVEHGQNFKENLDKVRSWKDCLATVATLSGWDVRNRNVLESIKIIAEFIDYKLSFTLPTVSEKLVGIDSRLEALNGYIGEEANSILFVGIYGMGGIGKTTLARVLYDRIRWQFEGSCFLANVREVFVEKEGPRRLQEQLLSEIVMERANVRDSSRGIEMIKRRLRLKMVLLVLDDVDDKKQLKFLAAEHGWFGPGSRIIITSRDRNVLDRNGHTRIYEVEKLNDADALELFSQKAFKKDQHTEDLLKLSKQVVGYANGLPLALEVIGLFLRDRSILHWESAINRLNDIPDGEIIDVLRISFDDLHALEKKIFLDIACFLKGFKKDRIIRILDSCGFHANIGIQVLTEKSLINVSRDRVWMHDLLQIMGKEIVRYESPTEPRRRSRLWAYNDVSLALMDTTEEEKVETIFLDMLELKEAQWNMKAFSKMSKLRLLKIHNVQLFEGPEHLSNELRFLEWHAYPSKSLPACFQLDKLVELDMAYSSIEQLWHGFKVSVNLKIINLSHSLILSKTPDFTGIPNLESLILEGCTSLSEVHPSLVNHKKLQFVNLVNCTSIRILPNNLEMESLKVFTLDGCSKLENFPNIVGNMNCLMKLRLDGTNIAELPLSIHYLTGLILLSMSNCKNLESIPSSIGCLKSLKKLDLSGCSELKNVPENLGEVESLEEFDVSRTSIRQPPASIFLLKNLKVLSFDGCERIAANPNHQVLPSLSGLCSLEVLDLCACNLIEGALPEDIGCLSSLRCLDLSRNNFVSLPKTINKLSQLETLVLEDCRMLESLPEVPSKVQTVNLNGCIRLKIIPDPITLSSSKRSEFICLNCWELDKNNGEDNIESFMLERYLQGAPYPRPGFTIVVPGNEIPSWFNHQSKGSSISVQVPSGYSGYALCVAFSAYDEISFLSCHIKANGREDYPSPMCISCNSIQVLSDHVWLFYLSFDYLRELKEWQHESFSKNELSFHFDERGVKVKNCGVCLLYTPSSQSFSTHFLPLPRQRMGMKGSGGEIVQGGLIVRSTRRKDRHSKVCTAKGPRDRRVRLSAHAALQFYDLQNRLGYDQPSKAVDWLIKKAKSSIDKLSELPPLQPTVNNTNANLEAHQKAGSSEMAIAEQPESAGYTFQLHSQLTDHNPSNDSSFLAPTLDPDTMESNSSMSFQSYPTVISRTTNHTEGLGLSLHSFQDQGVLLGQLQADTTHTPSTDQTLFEGSAPVGFDANFHRMVAWSNDTSADNRVAGGFAFNPPPLTPHQAMVAQASAFTQRGPLQSSFLHSIRSWNDLHIASTEHHRTQEIQPGRMMVKQKKKGAEIPVRL